MKKLLLSAVAALALAAACFLGRAAMDGDAFGQCGPSGCTTWQPQRPVAQSPLQYRTIPDWVNVPRKTNAADPYGYAGQDYGGPHETTHLIDSQLRQWACGGYNACYVMNGLAAMIREPRRVTINDVAAAVPVDLRDDVYRLYLVQQAREWNQTPMYLMDELAAYLNGAYVYQKTGDTANAQHSVRCAVSFIGYCEVMSAVLKAKEPEYDQRQFLDVLDYQRSRIVAKQKPSTQVAGQTPGTFGPFLEGNNSLPSTQTPPLPPPPVPTIPTPDPCDKLTERVTAIEKRVDDLLATVLTLPQPRDGKDGKDGKDGTPGIGPSEAEDLRIGLDHLTQRVAALEALTAKPISVVGVDKAGTPYGPPVSVNLGDTLKLQAVLADLPAQPTQPPAAAAQAAGQ